MLRLKNDEIFEPYLDFKELLKKNDIGSEISIVIENNLSWHDIAALVPVIEEAGGCVCDWKGNKIHEKGEGDIIACNNKFIQNEVLKLMMRNK
mgnify:CR=1 FL=1